MIGFGPLHAAAKIRTSQVETTTFRVGGGSAPEGVHVLSPRGDEALQILYDKKVGRIKYE